MTPEEVLALHAQVAPTDLELRRYGPEAKGWCSYEQDPAEPYPCPAASMARQLIAARWALAACAEAAGIALQFQEIARQAGNFDQFSALEPLRHATGLARAALDAE